MSIEDPHITEGHRGASGNRRTRLRLASGVIALAALIIGAGSAGAAAGGNQGSRTGLVVATAGGAVRGKTTGTTDEFLGLPYAAPPVGPLRWQPPQPAASWQGVREATRFAPHCAQPASAFGVASTSEDCLYLNVFTPAEIGRDGHALPVVVWIHGGAFNWGESDDYDPTALVRQGVIVVTVNYRLGALGFLATPAIAQSQGGTAGDYGLMDQQAALRWVQANITGFGGDRDNVTVDGESSGGLSVLAQLASPGSRGLFSRAIAESGAYDLTPQSLTAAESSGETFATSAGCADQTLACLDALPVSTILAEENPAGYRPDIDGRFLTRSPAASFAGGRFNRVPVIDGTNLDEYRLFVAIAQLRGAPVVTAANYQGEIAATLGVPAAQAAAIAAQYPLGAYSDPSLALGAVGTDAIFACPALSADEALSKYVPVYAYEFNDTNAPQRYLPPVGFPYGAAHESEVQYLFTLQNTANPGVLSAPQWQLATDMKQYWTSFARHVVPASSAGPQWPRFNDTSQQMLSLNTPVPTVESGLAAEHDCAFWASPG